MMMKEREVVIQFSLIPMGVMPSSLCESGAEYHAGDIRRMVSRSSGTRASSLTRCSTSA